MNIDQNESMDPKPDWSVFAVATGVVVLGLTVLAGWGWEIESLKRVLPGLVSLKANLAAGFVFAGICLALQSMARPSPLARWAGWGAAMLTALIGLVTLAEYSLGRDAGVDQLLFRAPEVEVFTGDQGRMSPLAAANLVFLGGILLLLNLRRGWRFIQGLVLVIGLLALLPVAGYMFGDVGFPRIGSSSQMAAHAAGGFLALVVGIFMATSRQGYLARLRGHLPALAFSVSLIVLISAAAAAYVGILQRQKAVDSLERSHDVLFRLESVSSELHKYEQHVWEFMVAGDEIILPTGIVTRQGIKAQLDSLRQLTKDNPSQQERLLALEPVVEAYFTGTGEILKARAEQGARAAATILGAIDIIKFHDEIEVRLEAMQQVEQGLLVERQQSAKVQNSSTLMASTVSLAAGLALLMLAFAALRRDIAGRKAAEERLRGSESRLRRAESLARIGHYEVSTDLSEIEFSESFKILWGFEPESEPTVEEIIQRIHPDDLEWVLDAFSKAGENQEDYNLIYRIVRPDGSEITLNSLGEYSQDENDGATRFFGTQIDITERRRTEEVLENRVRERTAQLSDALELNERMLTASTVGIAAYDDQGNCIFANEAMGRIIGATQEEMLAQNFHSIDSWRETGLMELAEQALTTGEQQNRELYLTTSFDRDTWLDCFLAPFTRGGIDHLLYMVNDISERKEAESMLRESEERFRVLAENSPVGIFRSGEDGFRHYVNPAYEKIMGRPAKELMGWGWMDTRHPEDRDNIAETVNDSLKSKGMVDIEHRISWPDGQERWVHGVGVIYTDEQGENAYMGVVEDITARKQAEAEVKTMRDQLAVQQKMATVGQLTATVSHELRNPLGTIRTTVFNLRDRLDGGDSEIKRSLDRLERSVVRCDNIINDLLDFSRHREAHPEPTPLDAWLRDLLAEQEWPEWLEMEFNAGAEGLAIDLDQDRFRRAVINLVENAIQAMEEVHGNEAQRPCRLAVRTHCTEDRVEVTVSDSGPGMTPEVLEEIFEPLYSTKTYGVGLGLPTVRQIMEQEGGGVSIHSDPGTGTESVLWLPLTGRNIEVA